METKVFIISMVLCGELISYTSTTPSNELFALAIDGAKVEKATIKDASL